MLLLPSPGKWVRKALGAVEARRVTDYELEFWGDCANTWHEEQKQFVYANRMGLLSSWNCAHPPTYNIGGRSVLDIGGGPVSLLLKCINRGYCAVVDPGEFPSWVNYRYAECGIEHWMTSGESLRGDRHDFDEVWIYNVLQHVEDPALVVSNARAAAKKIRIFDWIEVDPYPGHPHRLEQDLLDEWLGSSGYVAQVNEKGACGKAYYGVFA